MMSPLHASIVGASIVVLAATVIVGAALRAAGRHDDLRDRG